MTKKTSKKSAGSNRSKPDPLGQVKELLFGAEFTAQKQRTRTAEQRLQKKLERRSTELAERVTRLSTRVTKTKQAVEESIEELRREGVRVQREIQRQLAAAVKQLQAESNKALAMMETRVADSVGASQSDRTELAAMFEELARRFRKGEAKRKK